MDVHTDVQLSGQCHGADAGSHGTMTRLLAATAATRVSAPAGEASARTSSSCLESLETANSTTRRKIEK